MQPVHHRRIILSRDQAYSLPMAHRMTKKLFIVGTGRCGTHTLQALLATVPNTLSLHEGKGELDGKSLDVGPLNGLNVYLYHHPDRHARAEELRALSGEIRRIIDANFARRNRLIDTLARRGMHFADANRHAFHYIGYVHQQYPEAKFIHLVRDGYDCVRSWYPRSGAYPSQGSDGSDRDAQSDSSERSEFGEFRESGGGLGDESTLRGWERALFSLEARSGWPMREITRRARRRLGVSDLSILEAALQTNGLSDSDLYLLSHPAYAFWAWDKPVPLPGTPAAEAWPAFSKLERVAWFWAHTNELIAESLAELPADRSMLLRLEDLSEDTMAEVLHFAGLPESFSPTRLRAHDAMRHDEFDWSPERIRKFNRLAGYTMERCGYELRT